MLLMVRCNFGKASQIKHFQSDLGREGGCHKKRHSVYAVGIVANSGRFLTIWPIVSYVQKHDLTKLSSEYDKHL